MSEKTTIFDAYRIALGVVGTLAGVAIIVLLLVLAVDYTFVRPTVAGGLTVQERYDILAKEEAEDERLLSSYGWVDRSKGIVRIPIALAMQKIVEEQSKSPNNDKQ